MQPLEIIRGTTKTVNIAITDEGTTYVPSQDDKLIFAVKSGFPDSEYEIKKVLTAEQFDNATNVYSFEIKPDDTANLSIGRHFYDVGLQSGEDYIMVIECSHFDVMPNISAMEEEEE